MRGIGTTTAQMRAAAPNSFYVWVNGDLSYLRQLASRIGRNDLHIIGFLTAVRHGGMVFRGSSRPVTFDHFINEMRMSDQERDDYNHTHASLQRRGLI